MRPKFVKLPAIKGGSAGCLNCGVAHNLLPLTTRLYYGFGGWRVTCDGEALCPPLTRASGYKDVRRDPDGTMNVPDHPISKYERLAAKTRGRDWRAIFESPLHGETYQRQGRGHWVLVERNLGSLIEPHLVAYEAGPRLAGPAQEGPHE